MRNISKETREFWLNQKYVLGHFVEKKGKHNLKLTPAMLIDDVIIKNKGADSVILKNIVDLDKFINENV